MDAGAFAIYGGSPAVLGLVDTPGLVDKADAVVRAYATPYVQRPRVSDWH